MVFHFYNIFLYVLGLSVALGAYLAGASVTFASPVLLVPEFWRLVV